MNVLKYRSYLLLSFLVSLFSCKCNHTIDGGSCTYDTKIYPAMVINIETKDSLNADILFKIEDKTGNLYRDSVSWNMEKKEYALLSMIKKDSVEVGDTYQYIIMEIKTGHCTPKIEILKLEKYQ